MKIVQLLIVIGILGLQNISGYANGVSKILLLDRMSRHNAEYWFNEPKQIELCHAIEWGDI